MTYHLDVKANVNYLQMILVYFLLFTMLLFPKMIKQWSMIGHTNGKLNSIPIFVNKLKK